MKDSICLVCKNKFEVKTGLASKRKYCYDCMPDNITRSQQLIQLRVAMKKQLVLLHGGKCVICSYDKYSGALEFHHLDSEEKEFGIGSSGRKNYDKMVEESYKCILLCSNCHKELHAGLIDLSHHA